MKYFLPAIFLAGALFLTPIVRGEEFNFNRAYNDYTYTYDQYRLANNEYIMSRQAYLNYKTLTSKTDAQDKTLKMLQLRDNVVRTYLIALRKKLAEITGILNYKQNVLYLKLDTEINWYTQHHDQLSSAGTLEDLVSSSQEAQSKYQETEILIYQTLGAILAGKESVARDQINQQIENLKTKMAEIRQKGDKNTNVAERWLLEAENRLTRSQEKQSTAQQILTNLKPYTQDKIQAYDQAQFTLTESHQYLKEANSYLRELIKEVKHAD